MANLLGSIKAYVTPELLGQAAGLLGENEGGISKAVGGLVPTILAGIMEKSSDPNSMEGIFNTLSNFDSGVLNDLGSLIGGGNLAHHDPKDAAGHFLGSIFGPKVPAITNAVAAFSGAKTSSVSSLLGMAGPLVMGVLSKKIGAEGINASGFANLLSGQKNNILGALPTGLGSIIGLSDLGGVSDSPTEAATGNRWLWPLLLLVGLGGGIICYLKYCSAQPETVGLETQAPAPAVLAPASEPPSRPSLSFATGSQEAAMLAFVKDADADKNKWFDFPEIMFEVNKAALRPESEVKLNAVLAILREYPAVRLRIGGYTDSDGNEIVNLKLSGERANACKSWLTGKGIAPERLEAEGYGEQHPVAPNDTPENKAKNRRISFSVRAK